MWDTFVCTDDIFSFAFLTFYLANLTVVESAIMASIKIKEPGELILHPQVYSYMHMHVNL